MQIEQSTLVNIWYIPMYTPQWEYTLPGNSTKSPISNVCRTTSLCRLISCDILSYDSCKHKEGSGFNIQRNLSIPITLLTNHLFFTLNVYENQSYLRTKTIAKSYCSAKQKLFNVYTCICTFSVETLCVE